MNRLIFVFWILFIFSFCNTETKTNGATDHQHHDSVADQPTAKVLSPKRTAMANIGDVHVHIEYSSPGKRGRTIWNGLVGYDRVWVAGAHQATSIEFSSDVNIGGKMIKKGKYAFFAIPRADVWTLIINENYDQHLADDYNENLDLLRLEVEPIELSEIEESLIYQVIPVDDRSGYVRLAWDQIEVRLPIEI